MEDGSIYLMSGLWTGQVTKEEMFGGAAEEISTSNFDPAVVRLFGDGDDIEFCSRLRPISPRSGDKQAVIGQYSRQLHTRRTCLQYSRGTCSGAGL